MSAETIPAEVATDLDCIRWYVECLDAVAFKRRAVAGLAEAEGSYNAAMKRLTDRSTRPAEPAAPVAEGVRDTWFTDRALPVMAMSGDAESDRVLKLHFRRPVTDTDRQNLCDAMNLHQRSLNQVAEAGDGEVYLAEACKPWEFATGPVPAYDSPLHQVFVAGMLYTEQLLANHLGVKRYEAGDGSEDFNNDATMSLVNILAEAGLWDKDEWRSALEAERARADAAEQRAADALARAEKAERERDAYHDALTPDGDTKALMIGEFFEEIEVLNPDYDEESLDEDEDDEPEFITHRVPVSWTTTKAMMERLRSYAHRLAASREAQPATDGGDNG